MSSQDFTSVPNFLLRNNRPRSFSAGTSLHHKGSIGGSGRHSVVALDKTRTMDDGKRKQSSGNPSRYKTELCRPFQEYGYCKYGDKCQFAHGIHELRALPRHPKYKTDLCRTFHTRGFCPYGPRCHFIHSLDEARQPPPILTRASSANIMTSVPHCPPLSPSQDSGISSPDDTVNFFVGGSGKVFDFPLSDSSSEDADVETDSPWRKPKLSGSQTLLTPAPSSDWSGAVRKPASENAKGPFPAHQSPELFADLDSLSSGSSSPTKSTAQLQSLSSTEYDLSEQLSSISLDESTSSFHGHSRLPVFDDMVNSCSDTALDIRYGEKWIC